MGGRKRRDDRYTPPRRDQDRHGRYGESRRHVYYPEKRESRGSSPPQHVPRGPKNSSTHYENDRFPSRVDTSAHFTSVNAPPTPAVSNAGLGLDGASDELDSKPAIAAVFKDFRSAMARTMLDMYELKRAEDEVSFCKNKAADIPSGTEGDFAAMARQAQRSLKLAENRWKEQKDLSDAKEKESAEAEEKLIDVLLSGRPSAHDSGRVKVLEDRLQHVNTLLEAARSENQSAKKESEALRQELQKMRNGYAGLVSKVGDDRTTAATKQDVLSKELDALRSSVGKKESATKAELDDLATALKDLTDKHNQLQASTVDPFMASAEAAANQESFDEALDQVKARLFVIEQKPTDEHTQQEDLSALEKRVQKLTDAYNAINLIIRAEEDGLVKQAAESAKKADELRKDLNDFKQFVTKQFKSLERTLATVREKGDAHAARISDNEETMKVTCAEFGAYTDNQDQHNTTIENRLEAVEANSTRPRTEPHPEQDTRLASLEQRITELSIKTHVLQPDAEHRLQGLRSDLEALQQTCRFLQNRYNNVSTQGVVASMAQHYNQHYGFGRFHRRLEDHDLQLAGIHDTLKKWGPLFNAMNESIVKLRSSVARMEESVKGLEDSSEPSSSDLGQLLPQIPKLQSDLTVVAGRVTTLEGSLNNAADSVDSFTTKAEGRLNDFNEQLEQLPQLRERMEEASEQLKQLPDLRERIEEVSSSVELRIEEISKSIDTCNTNDIIRERKLSDLSSRQAQLAKSVRAEELTACQKQLHELKDHLQSFSSSVAKIDDIRKDLDETNARLDTQKEASDDLDKRTTSNINNFQTHVTECADKAETLNRTIAEIRANDIADLQTKTNKLQSSVEKMKKRAKEHSSQSVNGSVTGNLTPPDRSENNSPTPLLMTNRPQGRHSVSQNSLQSTLNGSYQNSSRKPSTSGSSRDTPSLGQQAAHNATRLSAASPTVGAGISSRDNRANHGFEPSPGPSNRSSSPHPKPPTAKIKDSDSSSTSTISSARHGVSTPMKSENTYIPPHATARPGGLLQPRAIGSKLQPPKGQATIVISDDEDDDGK